MSCDISRRQGSSNQPERRGRTGRKAIGLQGQESGALLLSARSDAGCTKEACAFQADSTKIQRKNAVVIGVSTDDEKSHQRFREKYDLTFPLLSDPEHKLADAYGVWQEKNMYGRKTWGVKRTTFIIDEQGRVAHVFNKVNVAEHSKEVLEKLDQL